ncbi:hypothetical protein B0J18DRAFT_422106 [Chaetomium sp. MPI-SDFR-AT-0129]|nr:hypothetical protein B0J18DRAFT_422106 [Chaetomium sp. MPI-SDFR-AT-0129]
MARLGLLEHDSSISNRFCVAGDFAPVSLICKPSAQPRQHRSCVVLPEIDTLHMRETPTALKGRHANSPCLEKSSTPGIRGPELQGIQASQLLHETLVRTLLPKTELAKRATVGPALLWGRSQGNGSNFLPTPLSVGLLFGSFSGTRWSGNGPSEKFSDHPRTIAISTHTLDSCSCRRRHDAIEAKILHLLVEQRMFLRRL